MRRFDYGLVLFVICSILACSNGVGAPHPYQGLVPADADLILQISRPKDFFDPMVQLLSGLGLPLPETRDWREWLVSLFQEELPLQESPRVLRDLLDSIDDSAPFLAAGNFSRDTTLKILMTLRDELEPETQKWLKTLDIQLEKTGRVTILTYGNWPLKSAEVFDLAMLESANTTSLGVWVNAQAPAISQWTQGLRSITFSLGFDETVNVKIKVLPVAQGEYAKLFSRMGRLERGSWEMLDKLPPGDFIALGSHLDSEAAVQLFQYILSRLGDFGGDSEAFQPDQLPEDPRFALGFAVKLKPNAERFGEGFTRIFAASLWQLTGLTTYDPLPLIQETLKRLQEEEILQTWNIESGRQKLQRNNTEYSTWDLSALSDNPQMPLTLIQWRDKDLFVTRIGSDTAENLVASLNSIPGTERPPFPEDTELVLWVDIDTATRLTSAQISDKPLGKSWFTLQSSERALEFNLRFPLAVVGPLLRTSALFSE